MLRPAAALSWALVMSCGRALTPSSLRLIVPVIVERMSILSILILPPVI